MLMIGNTILKLTDSEFLEKLEKIIQLLGNDNKLEFIWLTSSNKEISTDFPLIVFEEKDSGDMKTMKYTEFSTWQSARHEKKIRVKLKNTRSEYSTLKPSSVKLKIISTKLKSSISKPKMNKYVCKKCQSIRTYYKEQEGLYRVLKPEDDVVKGIIPKRCHSCLDWLFRGSQMTEGTCPLPRILERYTPQLMFEYEKDIEENEMSDFF